jgi:hypothetical protein
MLTDTTRMAHYLYFLQERALNLAQRPSYLVFLGTECSRGNIIYNTSRSMIARAVSIYHGWRDMVVIFLDDMFVSDIWRQTDVDQYLCEFLLSFCLWGTIVSLVARGYTAWISIMYKQIIMENNQIWHLLFKCNTLTRPVYYRLTPKEICEISS